MENSYRSASVRADPKYQDRFAGGVKTGIGKNERNTARKFWQYIIFIVWTPKH